MPYNLGRARNFLRYIAARRVPKASIGAAIVKSKLIANKRAEPSDAEVRPVRQRSGKAKGRRSFARAEARAAAGTQKVIGKPLN